MAERTVRAKFVIDVNGAVASVGKLATKIGDATKAGTDFAAKNKGSFDTVAQSEAAIGATAAVGLGLAIKKFADFDKQMSAVRAATGETAGNMNLLREAALQAGKDTAFSATEAAQGIENLAKAGVSTQAILGGGLKGALDLAAAGQISVAEASEVAATALTQFKLNGADVPHVADLLAAAAGKAQGEVSDMAMALKQSGLVASQFGLSIETTTGTLAAFASAGLLGSDAGTSFKTMLLALANPSKESAATMKSLGINAYDAQGAFIGIAPLAEQLKTQLSGLTEEQRNAALAQIFGNDAIRAANVLYSQGATGILDWTNKVNDAGYASETAKTKTDNLIGDVERLGGALDTALIQQGSGANSVLRAIVQGADSAVSAFTDLPPAVAGVATALTAVAAVGGLGAAGVLKAASAAGELRASWQGLGRVGKGLTLSMGAVGVALVAGVAIYSAFSKKNEEAAQRVQSLRDTLDQQTGAITGNTRAYVSNELATSGLAQRAKDMGLSLTQVTDAALGNRTALDQVVGSLDQIIAANDRYQRGSQNSAGEQQAETARKLREEIIRTSTALTDAQKTQLLAAEGSKQVMSATEAQAAAHKAAAAAAQEEAQSLEQLIAAMLRMPGMVLSLRDAQRGYQEAIDNATASLKENGKTLDISNAKGRANQAALDSIASSANSVTKAMMENGASNRAVVSTYEAQRAGLIRTATAFGMTRKQAEAYAAKVLAIPKRSDTTIRADISDLQRKLNSAKAQLKDPNLTKTRRAELTARIAQLQSAIAQAKGALASVPSSKTVTITVNTYKNLIETKINRGIVASGVGRATGGPVPGNSPSPYADDIPIMATSGEWVHQVAAVQHYGPQFMADVNARRFPKPKGYAAGGLVGGIDPFALFSGQFAAPGNPLAGLNFGRLRDASRQAAAYAEKRRRILIAEQRQLKAARDQQARVEKAQKEGAARLATLRATGSNEKAIRAQQLEQIRLTKQLNAAKAVTKKETTQVTAAEKGYAAAAAVSSSRSDAYKAAMARLNQVRQEAIQYAEQIADRQLQGSAITELGTTDRTTLLASLQERGKRLGQFAGTLEGLQAKGLSKQLLDQLREAGPGSAELASQILAGGSSYIGRLNRANAQLEGQAGRIGAGAALQQFSITNLTTNIQIGNEVVRVVKQVLKANNAQLKRSVTQKNGR